MDEKTIERISRVFNRDRGCGVVCKIISLIKTGDVVGEKFQPLHPVAGQTHRKDVFKATNTIGVRDLG